MKMKIKSIFVLGSTSLIAKQICLDLAQKGCSEFHLISRNAFKNAPLKNILINDFKAKVTEEVIDLEDENLFLENVPIIKDFDLYLITAGNLGNNDIAFNNLKEAKKINKINFYSLIPWLMAIVNSERINKNSRLWVFSSVASDRGRPSNYVYGASKAALSTFCEGLIGKCHNTKFKIRLIKAGFMDTPMSKDKVPAILAVSPKYVSKILLKEVDKSGIEYLPWWWLFIMKFVKLLPIKFLSKL